MLQMIASSKTRAELDAAAKDFIALARLEMLAQGLHRERLELAKSGGASRRVLQMCEKAAIGTLNAVDSPTSWPAGALTDYEQAEASYALRFNGVYDRMAPDMIPAALLTRLVISTTAIIGEEVGEGQTKPVHELAIDGGTMSPTKAGGLIIFTEELARIGGPKFERLLDREIRALVVAACDAILLAYLISLTSPTGSTGHVLLDLPTLMAQMQIGADARLYFVLRPEALMQLAVTPTTTGALAFPIGTNGGSLNNITVLASDALDEGQAVLVDATQLMTASAPIRLDGTRHSAPDLGGGTRSLWQRDEVGLRVERLMSVKAVRNTAVASLSNVAYSGDSP
jgi:hypothetical protein